MMRKQRLHLNMTEKVLTRMLSKKCGNYFFQCDRLEEAGCDSLVIVASGFNHIKMGSKKGINYLADFTSFIEGFSHYCQGNSFFFFH